MDVFELLCKKQQMTTFILQRRMVPSTLSAISGSIASSIGAAGHAQGKPHILFALFQKNHPEGVNIDNFDEGNFTGKLIADDG
jgi:hypothetical protein